jgi:hypothetical protein
VIVESLQAYSDLLAPFRRAPVGNNLLMPAQVSDYIRQGCLICAWTPDCLAFVRDVGSHAYLYLSARGEDARLPELPWTSPSSCPWSPGVIQGRRAWRPWPWPTAFAGCKPTILW